MTPTTAALALQFCNAMFTACPWAAPDSWRPAAMPDFFRDLFNTKPPMP